MLLLPLLLLLLLLLLSPPAAASAAAVVVFLANMLKGVNWRNFHVELNQKQNRNREAKREEVSASCPVNKICFISHFRVVATFLQTHPHIDNHITFGLLFCLRLWATLCHFNEPTATRMTRAADG